MFSRVYERSSRLLSSKKLGVVKNRLAKRYKSLPESKRKSFEGSLNFIANFWVCLPGILIMLSVPLILVFPQLIVLATSLIVFSTGAVLAAFAYKIVILKGQVEGILSNVRGSLFVQAVQVNEDGVAQNPVGDDKKVVFH